MKDRDYNKTDKINSEDDSKNSNNCLPAVTGLAALNQCQIAI